MKQRVAHITLGLDVGGQERLLVEMAKNADRARFDWTVIVLGQRGPLADALEAIDIPVVQFDMPPGLRPGKWRRLARLFRIERFDVVHTHDDTPLIYAMPAAWWAGVRRRIHTHHHGHLAAIGWRSRFLGRQAARFCQHFVCVSEDSARYMIADGVSQQKVQTIHNGIDLQRFAFHGPRDGGPIVTVARLSPEKDLANLLRAAQHLVAPFPQVRIEIAGAGPSREELDRLTQELRLGEHVTFLGEVRDIPALLARARLFVLPSLSEGISLTLLEAQACGLPVVATKVGGNPEVILDGATGLLVPANDPAALAQAMNAVLIDPARGRAMGAAGRRRVEEGFDIRTMTKRYEALYDGS